MEYVQARLRELPVLLHLYLSAWAIILKHVTPADLVRLPRGVPAVLAQSHIRFFRSGCALQGKTSNEAATTQPWIPRTIETWLELRRNVSSLISDDVVAWLPNSTAGQRIRVSANRMSQHHSCLHHLLLARMRSFSHASPPS